MAHLSPMKEQIDLGYVTWSNYYSYYFWTMLLGPIISIKQFGLSNIDQIFLII